MPPLARLKGLEPLAHCLEGSCSIHLSYRRVSKENKGQENGAGQTSPERGSRKAVLQTLWGKEGQGNGARDARRVSRAERTLPKRGPRKAVLQALWGKEGQGNGARDARRVSRAEWTLPRRWSG